MNDCENLVTCGFFQKHFAAREAACKGLIDLYCKGPRQAECKRKEYKKLHGTSAPDDMLPVGAILKHS